MNAPLECVDKSGAGDSPDLDSESRIPISASRLISTPGGSVAIRARRYFDIWLSESCGNRTPDICAQGCISDREGLLKRGPALGRKCAQYIFCALGWVDGQLPQPCAQKIVAIVPMPKSIRYGHNRFARMPLKQKFLVAADYLCGYGFID